MSNNYFWVWKAALFLQNSPEEEAELKKLKDIEKSVEQTAKKLEKVDGELTGLKNVCDMFSFFFFIKCL